MSTERKFPQIRQCFCQILNVLYRISNHENSFCSLEGWGEYYVDDIFYVF